MLCNAMSPFRLSECARGDFRVTAQVAMSDFLIREVKFLLVKHKTPPKNPGNSPKILGVDLFAFYLLGNSVLSFV